jgi:hypothetical protein
MSERAKQLANDHAVWVSGLLKTLGLNTLPIATAEYLYRTATEHGYGHGVEDTHSGFNPYESSALGKIVILKIDEISHIPGALDLRLPSVILECSSNEAWNKYQSELHEFLEEKPYSFAAIVERWDCLQALQTHKERGGYAETTYCNVLADLDNMHDGGLPVMLAKVIFLNKNAVRGYYSPETCQAIIAGTWTPEATNE